MKRSPLKAISEFSDSVIQSASSSRNRLWRRVPLTVVVVTLLWAIPVPVAQAQTFTSLYNFAGPPDGAEPYAALIQDEAGNLYGTTYMGGYLSCKDPYHLYGCGLVFEVNAAGVETVLHRFSGGTKDGEFPEAPLLRDRYGNLYGTATAGGTGNCYFAGTSGCGVVFEIDTAKKESVLYSFQGGTTDGCYPAQGLVMDKVGNLYGTTGGCGTANYGTVFKVNKHGQEVLLHSFTGIDDSYPYYGHLLIDAWGDLYGLTSGEADHHEAGGTLYKLTNKGKLTTLHSFTGSSGDGCYPSGTLAQDKSGSFYGTTTECGAWNVGTVWKVDKTGAETILHSFSHWGGGYPQAGVVLDSKGNMFGVAGTLWELRKNDNFIVLHSFMQQVTEAAEVLRDLKGGLYGTTIDGGNYGYGSVWSYK